MLIKILKFVLILLFYQSPLYSKNKTLNDFNLHYLSNYFSGIVAYENRDNSKALKFFNSSKFLIQWHNSYLKRYVYSLVLDGKVQKATNEIKQNLTENNANFFEAHLILALDSLKKKKYKKSKDHLQQSYAFINNDKISLIIAETLKEYLYVFDKNMLIAIFYEVKNTSNEQHTYVFAKGKNKEQKTLKHECNKNFYVSPFIGMRAKYLFTNRLTAEYINIVIDLYDNNNKKILMASQFGKFIEFKASKLLKYNLLNPLFGFKVMVSILFEALKIIIKGGKYYAREKKTKDTISFEGSF